MKVALPAFLATLSLNLVIAADVRADLISWTYSWSNSPTVIEADNPTTGSIALTNEPTRIAEGNSNIVATNLRTASTAPDSNPATFTDKGYTLVLTLTDSASGQSGTMTFQGMLAGTLTKDSSNIQNTFLGATMQSLVLGGNLYQVTIGPYTPPGPPSSANAGSVSSFAQVDVVHLVPEPSTCVLCVGGLVCLVGYGARRLRRRPVPA